MNTIIADYTLRENDQNIVTTLRTATRVLSRLGLYHASKWLSELLQGLKPAYKESATDGANPSPAVDLYNFQEDDQYLLAKAYFDCREFGQCSDVGKGQCSATVKWLSLYADFLDMRGKGVSSEGSEEYASLLEKLDQAIIENEDSFLIYLRALVSADAGFRTKALQDLIKSINLFPYNWSAWTKLTELVSGEEELLEVISNLPKSIMTRLFHLNASLEVHRAFEQLRETIAELQETFPGSVHLRSQSALLEYHLRDFEAAERIFDEIAEDCPDRFEDIDTYSNILYVMGKRSKLSQLAHRYVKRDKNRPETCCLVGNLYSLRGDHAKAIAHFRRALKLDPKYLAAWTLMGHEYVELSNTHAAIEAYRRACDANSKDYRAWYGLGQAYELLSMNVYALKYFQHAVSLRPFDSRMWMALGQSYTKLSKPHEALKCLKRAQLFAEPDEIALLRKLGDQCLAMKLYDEAALYWMRLIDAGEIHGLPQEDYLQVYNLLASYELGEFSVQAGQERRVGQLSLAEMYINKVLQSNGEEVEQAKKLLQTLRLLQVN